MCILIIIIFNGTKKISLSMIYFSCLIEILSLYTEKKLKIPWFSRFFNDFVQISRSFSKYFLIINIKFRFYFCLNFKTAGFFKITSFLVTNPVQFGLLSKSTRVQNPPDFFYFDYLLIYLIHYFNTFCLFIIYFSLSLLP